ncbi:MAG TPA: redoxin domain-containing protein, partial [Pirellulales bacterium]|nr:redoxin domain-containing protein [Pirellulales bacterium]
QILFLPAPSEINLEALYHEPLLERILGAQESGFPLPQLQLLFANQPFKRLFGDDYTTRWLGEKTLPGEETLSDVMEVTGSEGTFVLWVDPKTYLLRRMEIFDSRILREVSDGQKFTLTIDLKGAAFDGKIGPNAFKYEAPPTAKLVDHFVLMPTELIHPPSDLLGEKPGKFKFVDFEGKEVDAASLEGRVVVLDMWDMNCHWCFENFPNLEKVYRQYRDNPKVAILAVDNDPAEVSNKSIENAFTVRGLTIPVVRDPDRFSESVFKTPGFPSMIVLGSDGTVQYYDVGYKPNLAEALPKLLDKLLAGENVADQTLAEYRKVRADFERQLAEATVGVNQEIEMPRAKIAECSEPEKLKLEKLWTTEDIKNPGNVVVYANADGQQRIAVFDGWRTIAELDGEGKTIARHDIDLPEDGAATQLRTAVDGEGRRTFAAFAVAQRKVYLMDESWQAIGSYPEETRQGISDVQLADVDGDGKLEILVGYLGEVGVQCASLTGERIWSNRNFENVLSVAPLYRDPDGHHRILVGNERPALGVVDYSGTQLADIPVPTRPIDIIVAANLSDLPSSAAESGEPGAWRLAALSASKPSEFVAVGLDFHGSELWNYPLPVGVRNTPCDQLIPGHVLGNAPGQWLLTGADGSIHILAADGSLLDRYQYGDELTGIGTMLVDGQGVLLVATAHGLTAWKVANADDVAGNAPEPGGPNADATARKPDMKRADESSDQPVLKIGDDEPETKDDSAEPDSQ